MELTSEIKNIITEAKNICVIPSDNQNSESIPGVLALFYTLKELNKNVNLIIDRFPEKFNFLVPSLDFISQPKNFVISIPRNVADVSQIYYEKNDENLKIHLTLDNGNIKKDNISFYFSDAKPDLIITLGIPDFQKQLTHSLNSFGFLLDTPILNIDNNPDNTGFGKINLIKDCSLAELVFDVITSAKPAPANKNTAVCLLAGLMIYYKNFKSEKTNSRVFEIAAELTKRGASSEQITSNLFKSADQETNFWGQILQNIKTNAAGVSYATINSNEFQNFTEPQIQGAVDKIKMLGIQNDLLVLWKSHASPAVVKGFFYSKKTAALNKAMQLGGSEAKNDWVFIKVSGENITEVKDNILNLI